MRKRLVMPVNAVSLRQACPCPAGAHAVCSVAYVRCLRTHVLCLSKCKYTIINSYAHSRATAFSFFSAYIIIVCTPPHPLQPSADGMRAPDTPQADREGKVFCEYLCTNGSKKSLHSGFAKQNAGKPVTRLPHTRPAHTGAGLPPSLPSIRPQRAAQKCSADARNGLSHRAGKPPPSRRRGSSGMPERLFRKTGKPSQAHGRA